ncbi:MAG: hypothetical protein QOJ13_2278 [Gaiellales bacterium]|jgi:uncharacterized protein YkwD|nr:hypothetical protein [Gaiellales bacterium]
MSVALAGLLLISTATTASAGPKSTYQWRLFTAINEIRHQHHLRPLLLSTGLRDAAQRHSRDMVRRNYFAHTSPTGGTLGDRIRRSSFKTRGAWSAGENIAWGSGSLGAPRTVLRMWLKSSSHRSILLSSKWRFVGIGRATGNFRGRSSAAVWTADFGHR